MSYRTRVLGVTAALGTGTLLLLIVFCLESGMFPLDGATGQSDAAVAADHPNDSAPRPLPDRRTMRSETQEILAPDATYEQQVTHQLANYDRIPVQIHPDGSLSVWGKDMAMDALRSLIDDQQQEGIKTLVAIEPDSDCQYHHINHVIRMCQDLGVPHQMVATAAASNTRTARSAPPS